MEQKVKITQDTLYEYMLAHGIKMTRLAELIGKSDDVVTSCFKHHKDIHGRPRRFNAEHVASINEALPRISSELRRLLLTFGSPQTYTNRWGKTYDPGLIEPIKELGRYLNITSLTSRVLGWSKGKKSAVLVQTSSISYGCVSQQDVNAINTELLSVAGVFDSWQVVADED